jgi:hypothetical protein
LDGRGGGGAGMIGGGCSGLFVNRGVGHRGLPVWMACDQRKVAATENGGGVKARHTTERTLRPRDRSMQVR